MRLPLLVVSETNEHQASHSFISMQIIEGIFSSIQIQRTFLFSKVVKPALKMQTNSVTLHNYLHFDFEFD